MPTNKVSVIPVNPKGKLTGEINRSRTSKQWRWRTRSIRNGKITANGGESFKRIAGAMKGLMLHAGNVKEIIIIGK